MAQSWGQFHNGLIEKARINGIPIVGQFELTARCNLRCKMCYLCMPANDNKSKTTELTSKEWINLAKQAKDAGMFYLLLSGGEVFLRPDFKEIYEEINHMGIQIIIYTNGTLITPEIAGWLGRIPPARMEITLYGASTDTYQKVTGHADAFDRAIRGIDLLKSEGINLKLRTTVIKDNADDLEKMIDISLKRDILINYVFYVSPRRDKQTDNCESIRLTPSELTDYEHKAVEFYKKGKSILKEKYGLSNNSDNIKKSINIDTLEEIVVDNYKQDSNSASAFKCDAGKIEFWITWEGKMTPCIIGEDIVTYPLKTSFIDAWHQLKELCANIPSCKDCAQCSVKEYCWKCPVRLHIETGSYETKAPYLCEWASHRKILF